LADAELSEAVGTVAANGNGIPVGEQNLSESTRVLMFICEFGCGFTGAFEGVQAHEYKCAMRPGKDLADVKMKGNKTASPDPHGDPQRVQKEEYKWCHERRRGISCCTSTSLQHLQRATRRHQPFVSRKKPLLAHLQHLDAQATA